MAQYVHDNTDDEFTHFTFLNAYLEARGGEPVDLEPFRTLPSSTATGAQQMPRLTNLMQLTVDTSWWTRYRSSTENPDLGDTFPQAVPDLFAGQFPAIPRSDADLTPADHLQAIANTAGFHFATIEQGGTSLYPSLAQTGQRSRGAPRPAQHRADRDDALPDLERQGRQRAAADRPDERPGVPGSQLRRRLAERSSRPT